MIFVLKRLLIGASVALGLLAMPAGAQEEALKIGFIDAVAIVDNAPQGKAAMDNIRAELRPRQVALDGLQAEVEEKEQRLQNDTSLSEREREALRQEVRRLLRNMERGREELNEDFNFRRNEELEKLQVLVSDVIKVIAEEGQYDLIIQDPVVYVSNRVNITATVLEALDKEFNKEQ